MLRLLVFVYLRHAPQLASMLDVTLYLGTVVPVALARLVWAPCPPIRVLVPGYFVALTKLCTLLAAVGALRTLLAAVGACFCVITMSASPFVACVQCLFFSQCPPPPPPQWRPPPRMYRNRPHPDPYPYSHCVCPARVRVQTWLVCALTGLLSRRLPLSRAPSPARLLAAVGLPLFLSACVATGGPLSLNRVLAAACVTLATLVVGTLVPLACLTCHFGRSPFALHCAIQPLLVLCAFIRS